MYLTQPNGIIGLFIFRCLLLVHSSFIPWLAVPLMPLVVRPIFVAVVVGEIGGHHGCRINGYKPRPDRCVGGQAMHQCDKK